MDDEDDDEWDDPDTRCMTCGGDGMVDSVVEETLRYGWIGHPRPGRITQNTACCAAGPCRPTTTGSRSGSRSSGN